MKHRYNEKKKVAFIVNDGTCILKEHQNVFNWNTYEYFYQIYFYYIDTYLFINILPPFSKV